MPSKPSDSNGKKEIGKHVFKETLDVYGEDSNTHTHTHTHTYPPAAYTHIHTHTITGWSLLKQANSCIVKALSSIIKSSFTTRLLTACPWLTHRQTGRQTTN